MTVSHLFYIIVLVHGPVQNSTSGKFLEEKGESIQKVRDGEPIYTRFPLSPPV